MKTVYTFYIALGIVLIVAGQSFKCGRRAGYSEAVQEIATNQCSVGTPVLICIDRAKEVVQ